ncbi:arsenate reductase (glutaredoxin) [Shewanella avicenniae]|uniref:Arsenate reductase n=1 Tax=Shewanella avicenniae TaxID=2814294 RepID=A0ABX7QKU1_9GAMM|nr:arsenate reductase (glutaredoxin) [Shewanella avicenniae]QSX32004.1 arsenate reductase (glutaredoxin) [Shewanella avicenniae]
MTDVTLFHNPRCSKSRETLALLEQRGVQVSVVEYLKQPPSAAKIEWLLKQLNISARQLMRTKEAEYQEQNLADERLTEAQLIEAMVATPKLIERPIAINGDQVAIGRPPENVLAIL